MTEQGGGEGLFDPKLVKHTFVLVFLSMACCILVLHFHLVSPVVQLSRIELAWSARDQSQ